MLYHIPLIQIDPGSAFLTYFLLSYPRQFFPPYGPISGGTSITVTGINLGKSVSDIQGAVRVAGVTCQVQTEGYVPSNG